MSKERRLFEGIGDLGKQLADARTEIEVLKERLERANRVIDALAPGAKFVSYAHQEDNPKCPCNECRFAQGDPTEPDGSCAHDYLCAYCNKPADPAQTR